MSIPCENTEVIRNYGRTIDRLTDGQLRLEQGNQALLIEMRTMLSEIKEMFRAGVTQGKDIEQLKHSDDTVFAQLRDVRKELDNIARWQATVDARVDLEKLERTYTFVAENRENVAGLDEVYTFIDRERGWRGAIPASIAALALFASLTTCAMNSAEFVTAKSQPQQKHGEPR